MAGDAEMEGASPSSAVNFRLHRVLTGHKNSVASVKFSPNGKWRALLSRRLALWTSFAMAQQGDRSSSRGHSRFCEAHPHRLSISLQCP